MGKYHRTWLKRNLDPVTKNSLNMAIAHPVRRLLPVYLLSLCLLTLVGCNPLDVRSLEAKLKTQLQEQGNLKIKSVTCPESVAKEAGASFQCEGALEPDGKFIIQVEQKDDKGQTSWEVPNSKGMLNLALLETELTKEIAKDTKVEPAVRCGSDRYRVNRPGDSFDCQLKNATLAKAKGLIEKVTVTIDTDGNVAWQQIRRTASANATAATTPAATTSAATTPATPGNAASPEASQPTSSSQRVRPRVSNTLD